MNSLGSVRTLACPPDLTTSQQIWVEIRFVALTIKKSAARFSRQIDFMRQPRLWCVQMKLRRTGTFLVVLCLAPDANAKHHAVHIGSVLTEPGIRIEVNSIDLDFRCADVSVLGESIDIAADSLGHACHPLVGEGGFIANALTGGRRTKVAVQDS